MGTKRVQKGHKENVFYYRVFVWKINTFICSYGVMVSTLDFESNNLSSNLGRSYLSFFFQKKG